MSVIEDKETYTLTLTDREAMFLWELLAYPTPSRSPVVVVHPPWTNALFKKLDAIYRRAEGKLDAEEEFEAQAHPM